MRKMAPLGRSEEGDRHRGAQHIGPEALVEAGGMAKRRTFEKLHQCLMLGIVLPPRKSRVYLARQKPSWTLWARSSDGRFTPESNRLLRCREMTL
jgi:hypothetical protein